MMNLDEILKGIGSQMSRAATPPWSTPGNSQPSAPVLPPQLQNPGTDMGAFGSYLSNTQSSPFPEAPSFGGAFAEQPGFSGGFQEKNVAPVWDTTAGRQQSALGHIAAATAPPTPYTGTKAANDGEIEAYIRQASDKRGINPDTSVKVWSHEGRSGNPGDANSSFGPYQLHYGNVAGGGNSVSGLGDAFTKATGLDARDPATWQAQVDYALDNVKSSGWGAFHGADAGGVGQWDGIGTKAIGAMPNAQAGQNIMAKVQPFLGSAYVWGGKTDKTGFDCSGLAGYLTTGQPESTRTLYAKSTPIDPADVHPGDLVFYNMAHSTGPADEHVATAIENGQIVQAGGTAHNVNIAPANQFTAPGWQPEYRRLVGG